MQNSPENMKQEKVAAKAMSDDRKSEVVAQFTDDVLSKLTGAFVDVCSMERWTKRDLSLISGINETAIGHILAGRRKNLTMETIALLARALQSRPELVLHETRPVGNKMPSGQNDKVGHLFPKVPVMSVSPRTQSASAYERIQLGALSDIQDETASAERVAYDQPALREEVL